MADNFNMKQFLAENKLGAYSKLKEEESLSESEFSYIRDNDGICYRVTDEGSKTQVADHYCGRGSREVTREEKVEEAGQGTLMIIDRVEEIVNNLARNISTNSNIPTQEKLGLVQALKELKDLVEDLGADAEQEEDEYISDYSRRRASELNEMLSSKTMNYMDNMVPELALKAFINGAQAIIKDFKQESFEEEDIFDYLVSKIKTLG